MSETTPMDAVLKGMFRVRSGAGAAAASASAPAAEPDQVSTVLKGMFQVRSGPRAKPATASAAPGRRSPSGTRVRALYASETGNAQRVAEDLAAVAERRGLDVGAGRLNDVSLAELTQGSTILVTAATTDEGDVPYNAQRFWSAISADTAPRLDGVRFAVLALGDSDYLDFCQAGVDIDARLAQLGAERVHPLVRCDADYAADAARWTGEMIDWLSADAGIATSPDDTTQKTADAVAALLSPTSTPVAPAIVEEVRRLSGEGSSKDVWHVRLRLEERIDYRAGDSIGVTPVNDPALVETLLGELGVDGDLVLDGATMRERLSTGYEIGKPSRELAREVAYRTEDADIEEVLSGGDRRALADFLWDRDVLDLVRLATRQPFTAAELLDVLRPVAERSYSIASSPLVDPDRIDLTVGVLRYRAHGRDRGGVSSGYLVDRVRVGDRLTVTLKPNELFRLPDDDVPVIMVGPGTGVAPFRAFLQERGARGATGRNWLFFGARNSRCDSLYREELARMQDVGLLTRLDAAFSRDTAQKVYVHHQMREQGARLFRWLEDGASFYVCGDADGVAGDVDLALKQIVAEQGRMSATEALDYVDALSRDGRYLRDVY